MILETSFVPTFVALTSAPGMAAPDASRTDPTIDPPLICAQHSLAGSSVRATVIASTGMVFISHLSLSRSQFLERAYCHGNFLGIDFSKIAKPVVISVP